jgi:hypothetical protein
MNTLGFKRQARKATDGAVGLLYVHRWATGYQLLVFRDRAHAERWAANESTPTKVMHS